ncbi:hypothetical protein DFA_01702 [Cavenderia fasciculata]|uniref:Uncharacterized protein n=1 Tax=Cavenderia fasciculata TaxID=261658 RepID=F4PUA1_CACFS|nr:uncharacterized protein DFA_01702 [Cavenderia fasciculata]EGG21816.1 hypothetical protein DFA_01702 [Cavenderia fasciculata]|eukprot:XP_004359666.1 hypothetical protein DFA_01702 [Cavenderia fasciculata]
MESNTTSTSTTTTTTTSITTKQQEDNKKLIQLDQFSLLKLASIYLDENKWDPVARRQNKPALYRYNLSLVSKLFNKSFKPISITKNVFEMDLSKWIDIVRWPKVESPFIIDGLVFSGFTDSDPTHQFITANQDNEDTLSIKLYMFFYKDITQIDIHLDSCGPFLIDHLKYLASQKTNPENNKVAPAKPLKRLSIKLTDPINETDSINEITLSSMQQSILSSLGTTISELETFEFIFFETTPTLCNNQPIIDFLKNKTSTFLTSIKINVFDNDDTQEVNFTFTNLFAALPNTIRSLEITRVFWEFDFKAILKDMPINRLSIRSFLDQTMMDSLAKYISSNNHCITDLHHTKLFLTNPGHFVALQSKTVKKWNLSISSHVGRETIYLIALDAKSEHSPSLLSPPKRRRKQKKRAGGNGSSNNGNGGNGGNEQTVNIKMSNDIEYLKICFRLDSLKVQQLPDNINFSQFSQLKHLVLETQNLITSEVDIIFGYPPRQLEYLCIIVNGQVQDGSVNYLLDRFKQNNTIDTLSLSLSLIGGGGDDVFENIEPFQNDNESLEILKDINSKFTTIYYIINKYSST